MRSISCAEEVDNLRDSRRTETVTWRQFDETLALGGFSGAPPLCSRRRRSPNVSQN